LDECEKNINAQQDESDNDSCSSVDTSILLDEWEKKSEESRAKLERTNAELNEWSETAARKWEELQKKWEKYDKEAKERQKRRAARQRQQKAREIEYEYQRAHSFDVRLIVPNIIEDIEEEEGEEEIAIESSKRDRFDDHVHDNMCATHPNKRLRREMHFG
jgi:hypothetical protein